MALTAVLKLSGDEGKVTRMARPANGQPEPDPYQLLGVARQATPAEITQAWRRRARAEHPDARPRDVGAPARFRALAEAYEMLSDPVRRAAYDQEAKATAPEARSAAGTAVRVTVLARSRPPAPSPASAPARGAPLRAGPVHVEPPDSPSVRGPARDERAQFMLVAGLAVCYLEDVWDRPW
jgi:curved DNA-binding protein CbpA